MKELQYPVRPGRYRHFKGNEYQVLGKLELDKDHDAFEGEIQWRGKDVLLSLEVNAESKPSWTRARSAAKKLLADCETWDKAMRELAAKNLTELANNWLSQDEEPPFPLIKDIVG